MVSHDSQARRHQRRTFLRMGLDAYVPCDCFEQGIGTPPPCAVRIDPNDGLVPADEDQPMEALIEFDKWWASGCVHPSRALVLDGVANWSGVREFRDFMTSAGTSPTLLSQWPQANGGKVTPDLIPTVLQELAKLKKSAMTWPGVVVIGDGVTVWDHSAPGAVWVLDGRRRQNVTVNCDPPRLMVTNESDACIFEADEFEQTVNGVGQDAQATLRAPDGSSITVSAIATYDIAGNPSYPRRFRIQAVSFDVNRFSDIIDVLIELFTVADEHRSSVYWT
jgi:hypothetical protein